MDRIEFAGKFYSQEDVIQAFSDDVTPHRLARIEEVVARRSLGVVTVLEDIYDRGNASAVMRSAEAFGFIDFHLIQTHPRFKKANRVTKGADKWLNVKKWTSTKSCIEALRNEGRKIYVTHLDEKSKSIYDLDWTVPAALVLGNEKDGVSQEMIGLADDCFVVPMAGFVQSFNISVAGALCLHYAFLEQQKAHPTVGGLSAKDQRALLADYLTRAHVLPERIFQSLTPKESGP